METYRMPMQHNSRTLGKINSQLYVKNSEEASSEIKLYFKRWIILLFYVLVSIASTLHIMQFTIIGNISSRYFGLPFSAIQWTTLIIDVICLIGILPATYIIDIVGLRYTCILMSVLSTVGTWIKYFFISPNGFIPIIIGQIIIAPCMIPSNSLPAMVSSHWFGENELSTAVGIGFFGMTLGISMCNVLMPTLIKNHENLDDIGQELSKYLLYLAISTTVLTVVIFIWFENQPKLAPSSARFLQKHVHVKTESFQGRFRRLLRNRNLMIFSTSYGLCVSYIICIVSLLNPLYLAHFKNEEQEVGWCAAIQTLVGISGSVVFGRIVDRTKKYKLVMAILYLASILAAIFLAGSFYMEKKWMVFVSIALTGLFGCSYISIGCDTCVELMYPESEVLITGLLNTSGELFGITVTLIASKLMQSYSDMVAHLFLILILVLSALLMLGTKYDQRRHAVSKENNARLATETDNLSH